MGHAGQNLQRPKDEELEAKGLEEEGHGSYCEEGNIRQGGPPKAFEDVCFRACIKTFSHLHKKTAVKNYCVCMCVLSFNVLD